jgi:hypothetical protein
MSLVVDSIIEDNMEEKDEKNLMRIDGLFSMIMQ